jgi:FixJ family two-component response regulator
MGTAIIAIVDDDEAVRESIASLIGSLGYISTQFSSAEQFLAEGDIGSLDCLITDLHMKGQSGVDLMIRAHAVRPDLPVIIITAFPDSPLMRDITLRGAAGVFSKPFVAADLGRRLADVIVLRDQT